MSIQTTRRITGAALGALLFGATAVWQGTPQVGAQSGREPSATHAYRASGVDGGVFERASTSYELWGTEFEPVTTH